MWKVMYCFLKTVQDFLYWISFTLAYLAKTPCFYILRKKLLLQQMRDYLLCKISANNSCICCCIISYYWISWLIIDLHFLFKHVFLNSALSFVFQFTSFSSNSLTCLFEIFLGNIVNIKGFLIVLNKNCLSSFNYHVLFRSQPLLRSRISCREI